MIDFVRRKLRHARFLAQYWRFKRQSQGQRQDLDINRRDRTPCFDDSTPTTHYDRHYVGHTSWAARRVKEISPPVHVDIGSTLYFCGIVSAFVPVRFYDYRPASMNLSRLETGRADLVGLPFQSNSVQSLSCMHVIEHIGLGRYGDPIDAGGDLRAISELRRVICPGGHLLVVVPVGRPRVAFNAHRVYSYDRFIRLFPDFELVESALIPDSPDEGLLIQNPDPAVFARQDYGCGCFHFRKRGD